MFQYLQEWNEACVYAGECLPPFAYMLMQEPYTAILSIAAVCFAIYKRNEWSRSR